MWRGAHDVLILGMQADGRTAFPGGGLLLELGCFHRGVFRECHGVASSERTLGLPAQAAGR